MADLDPEQLGELLSAYLDGELEAEEVQLVERTVGEDEGVRRLLEELRRTRELVAALPRHAAPSSIAADVQFRLERAELLGSADESRVPYRSRRTPWTARLSIAAMVGLIAVVGWWFMTERDSGDSGIDPNLLAVADKDREAEPAAAADELVAEKSGTMVRRGEVSDDLAPARKGRGGEKRGTSLRGAAPSPAGGGGGPSGPPAEYMASASERDVSGTAGPGPSADARLIDGIDVAGVRAHSFASESIRLRITVSSEAQRDAVAARLVERLKERRSVDLATMTRGDVLQTSSAGSFFYRGASGVNFNETGAGQILVRASREQVDGLVEELARSGDATEEVALTAGPLAVRGVERSRQVLGLLTETEPAAPSGPGEGVEAGGRPAGRFTGGGSADFSADDAFLGELLRNIGVDTKLLASASSKDAESGRLDSTSPDAIALAQGKGTEDEGRTTANEAIEISEGKAEGLAVGEPGRLVDRRGRALEESKRTAGETTRARGRPVSGASSGVAAVETEKGGGADQPTVDRYVTFVIEVVVGKPETKPTGARAQPSRPKSEAPPTRPPTANADEKKQ